MDQDEKAIRDLIAEWIRATAAGDAEALRPLIAEDVAFLTPGQPAMRGRDLFVDGLKIVFGQMRIEPAGEVREVGVAGNLAYSWTTLTVTMTPLHGGAKSVRAGDTLTVLRKENGRWVIARDANLLVSLDDD